MIKPNMLFTKVAFSLSIAILALPIVAQADLRATSIGDDPIVFDASNERIWYPLMSNMIQMTKEQQSEAIQQLNDAHFAQKSNWRFATIGEVIALVE